MAEQEQQKLSISSTYEIKLKDESVPVDGFTLQVQEALEDNGIILNNMQYIGTEQAAEKKSIKTILSCIYYLIKYTSHTDKYRTLTYDKFKEILDPNVKIKDLVESLTKMYMDSFGIDQEEVNKFQKAEEAKKK